METSLPSFQTLILDFDETLLDPQQPSNRAPLYHHALKALEASDLPLDQPEVNDLLLQMTYWTENHPVSQP